MFFKRLLIYLTPLVNGYFFYLILTKPKIAPVVGATSLFVFLVIFSLIIWQKTKFGEKIIFYHLLFWFIATGFLFLIVIDNIFLKYLIVILSVIIPLTYFYLVFNFLYLPEKHRPFSLVIFSEYLSFLIIFFAASALSAFNIFLNFSSWLAGLIMAVLAMALVGQLFWLRKYDLKNNRLYLLLTPLLSFEIFTLLNWWPISYYVKGLVFTSFFYLLISLINHRLGQSLNRRIVWRNLAICLSIIIIILLSARWF